MLMRGLAAAALLAGCLGGSVKSDDPDTDHNAAQLEFDHYIAPSFEANGCNDCHNSIQPSMLSYDSLIQHGYNPPYGIFTYESVESFLVYAHTGDPQQLSKDEQKLIMQWLLDEASERD